MSRAYRTVVSSEHFVVELGSNGEYYRSMMHLDGPGRRKRVSPRDALFYVKEVDEGCKDGTDRLWAVDHSLIAELRSKCDA